MILVRFLGRFSVDLRYCLVVVDQISYSVLIKFGSTGVR